MEFIKKLMSLGKKPMSKYEKNRMIDEARWEIDKATKNAEAGVDRFLDLYADSKGKGNEAQAEEFLQIAGELQQFVGDLILMDTEIESAILVMLSMENLANLADVLGKCMGLIGAASKFDSSIVQPYTGIGDTVRGARESLREVLDAMRGSRNVVAPGLTSEKVLNPEEQARKDELDKIKAELRKKGDALVSGGKGVIEPNPAEAVAKNEGSFDIEGMMKDINGKS